MAGARHGEPKVGKPSGHGGGGTAVFQGHQERSLRLLSEAETGAQGS